MQRRELVKRLRDIAKANGLTLTLTEGGKHTKVTLGEKQTVIPRHTEINENTARAIIAQLTPEEE